MGDATKSRAAEIAAVSVEALAEAIRRQVVLLRFNEARTLDDSFDADEIELLCIRAANAVKNHVASEIAALQSRAFEDGARWTFTGKSLLSFGGGSTHEWFRRSDGLLRDFPHGFDPNTGAYGGAHVRVDLVDALPLQPEGERNA